MNITQRPSAESVAPTWVNVAINHCVVPRGRNFENLTNLKMAFIEGKGILWNNKMGTCVSSSK